MGDDLVLGMAGAGGDGIVSAGESLLAALAADGYYAVMTKSFGSQIRGGESSCRLRVSTRPLLSSGGGLDVAVALNWEDFLKFGAELPVSGRTVVLYDSRTGVAPDALPLGGVVPLEAMAVPITDLAREAGGSDRAKNTVVLGLLAGWFELAGPSILRGLRKKFAKKGDAVTQANERAFDAGLGFASTNRLQHARPLAAPLAGSGPRLVVDGNEMCAAAAIFAGVEFFAGYPITPSTEIMQFLDRELWKHGGCVLQAEDEIASLGAVVGASFAGRKSMTATSGPGLSLKTEMLGLATIAELPLVCVDVQRGGPSTGLPTKSEQSDLFQAAFSAHGDTVRPILAPTTVADTFATTVEAFNIAEQYQTPVLLLSDQEIGQRKETIAPPETVGMTLVRRREPTGRELESYTRFHLTESGVSPISHPGMPGGNYLAAGIEHREDGSPTASGEMHARMNAKRFRKLQPLKARRDLFAISGDPHAALALVGWGSVAGVVAEALERGLAEGLRAKLLVPRLLYPISEEVYQDFFASVRRGLVVEQSHQGQLYRILRMFVDLPPGVESLAKSGANPITADDVLGRLRGMVRSIQSEPRPGVQHEIG
jgi:2-oxoglutarate ferredoxin oxidoreductase subunit alpha